MKKISVTLLFLLLISSFSFAQIQKKEHIKHLKKIKVNKINDNTANYDFTTGSDKYYGTNGTKEVEAGVWGMIAGDTNADGFIDASDYTGPDNENFQSGYLTSDTNMDGFVDASDFVPVDNNNFKGTQVP